MEPDQALADLMEISTQVETAIIVDGSGGVVASTLADEQRAAALARVAHRLREEAERARPDQERELVQLELALRDGSVFLVRHDEHAIVATTGRDATVGLVFYDLKSCLRSIAEEEPVAGEAS